MYQKVNGQTGYEIAADIDNKLNKLLELSPPSADNYMTWLRLARTLKTSCELIEEVCQMTKHDNIR